MNEPDQIKQLQQDIIRLTEEINRCRTDIAALQHKLTRLDNTGHPTYPSNPRKDSDAFHISDWKLENIIGFKLIHLVGIVVLVIGLSIGVKYAIDRNLISEAARIGLAYGAGMVLYASSFILKKHYTAFSAILFSGAMASLYFTTYAAFVYYGLFSAVPAFALMMAFTLFTAYQAIVYNRKEIALLGLVGAYAIPFLISKNADRADLFFFYISLINSGVVFLSVKKQWKLVGRTACLLTWILFIGWASVRFEIKMQGIGLLFMSFFFLLFSFNTVSYKLLYQHRMQEQDAYQMVLNNIALYMASLFLFGQTFTDKGIAVITLIHSILTGLQSLAIHFFWKAETFTKKILAVLSLVFLAVFIAFRWEGLMVTLLWLFTAVVVFGWGIVQKSGSARMIALLLMAVTLLKLVFFDSLTFSSIQKVISYIVLGVLLLVVSFFYQKFRQRLFSDEE